MVAGISYALVRIHDDSGESALGCPLEAVILVNHMWNSREDSEEGFKFKIQVTWQTKGAISKPEPD